MVAKEKAEKDLEALQEVLKATASADPSFVTLGQLGRTRTATKKAMAPEDLQELERKRCVPPPPPRRPSPTRLRGAPLPLPHGGVRHVGELNGGGGEHSLGTPTTGIRERGNDTSKSTGRSGRQNAATRRNMRREERVTVQGPVKEQPPDGMSRGAAVHRGTWCESHRRRTGPPAAVH